MRTAVTILIVGLCLSALAAIGSAADKAAPVPGVTNSVTEFVMEQNFHVETVTCKSYLALGDLHQYGHVEGSDCTRTDDLLDDGGDLGNIWITFDFTDGTSIYLANCRFDATTFTPGYNQVAINCTH
jgi:hypothetical protein